MPRSSKPRRPSSSSKPGDPVPKGPGARLVERSRYHHGDVQRALLEAAVEALRVGSAEALSLRELARTIGVSHAAVYRHFADKDALLAAVAEDGWRRLFDKTQAELATPPLSSAGRLERVVAVASFYVTFAMAHPGHYRVMSGPRLNETARFPNLESAVAACFSLLMAEIEAVRSEGAMRAGVALDWALRVWMFAHGYVTLVQARRVPVKRDRVETYFRQLIAPFVPT